jgi:hypothetical protein
MNPFLNDPRRIASAFIFALFAILACLYLTSCSAIPYRVSLNYGGASASYDGKRVLLDVNGDEVGKSLRGYAK